MPTKQNDADVENGRKWVFMCSSVPGVLKFKLRLIKFALHAGIKTQRISRSRSSTELF
jgi:hypothetical protein